MQCRLLLIRHGESVLGSQGRYAGHFDTPLTPKGRRQIARLRTRLDRHQVHHFYSSDLGRCSDSARILAAGRSVTLSKRLREIDFGAWEGRTHDELLRLAPLRYKKWLDDPKSVAPPRGESLHHLKRRIRSFIIEIADRHLGKTVALITHGGPIRILAASTLDDFRSIDVRPASLNILNWPSLEGVAS